MADLTRHAALLDDATQVWDGGAKTASGYADVGGSVVTIDLGGDVETVGMIVFNLDAMDATTGDEHYVVSAQGSTVSDFATERKLLGSIHLGDTTQTNDTADSALARYLIYFNNKVNGTIYRYLRIRLQMFGTTPSIDGTAWFTKRTI